MPATTLSLANHSATPITFSLVGQNATGGEYKLATRPLSEPLSLTFSFKVSAPGSKQNDKLSIILRDTKKNATTGEVVTGSVRMEVSVPRDSGAWSGNSTEDIITYVADFFGRPTWRQEIADAMMPSQEA